MNATARGYLRQRAVDALADGYVLAGIEETHATITARRAVDAMLGCLEERDADLLGRIENLRAALASIHAKACTGHHQKPADASHFCLLIEKAAQGALEADDKAAHPMRTFVAGPDGHVELKT